MRLGSRSSKWYFIVAVAVSMVSTSVGQKVLRAGTAAKKESTKNVEWVNTGLDAGETRYSSLDQINTSNVSRLGLAWYYDTHSALGALEATPVVSNGIMYGTLSWSMVFAVDAQTGKELWRFDPKLGRQNFPLGPDGTPDPTKPRTGPSPCCGAVNRGVVVYNGKIYVGTLDGRLIALDAKTGKIDWQVHTTDPDSDYTITGAPRIAGDKVIIGNGGGEYALRGYVTAYDAETGRQAWRFYTVPGDPSKPFENKAMAMAAKTWTGNVWYKMGGGANAWDAFAYDPDLDLVYFGTGNGGPYPQIVRSPEGGDNLFICSILAVRASTGEYVWHYQVVPSDEWDYDSVQSLILANLNIDGKARKVIMQASKDGYFYVLDRTNGKFISAVPIVKVTWTTGLDPKTGRPNIPASSFYDRNSAGVWLTPSGGGVHNWHPMSFNPNTGLAYVPAGSGGSEWFTVDPSFKFKEGNFNWAQLRNPPTMINGIRAMAKQNTPPPPGMNEADGEAVARPAGATSPGAAANTSALGRSFLVAWDPVTQKAAWSVPGLNGGGTVTTAGNLVFAESNDGHLVALSADKGSKLWEFKLIPGLASPMTYMIDGKQYVSILGGGTGNGRLFTFALDANTPLPAPAASAHGSSAPAYTEEQATRGKAAYAQSCTVCHGDTLAGIGENPALTGSTFSATWNGHSAGDLFELIRTTMPKGSPNTLKPDVYTDILAYIMQVNKMPAGQDELKNDPAALDRVIISVGNGDLPRDAGQARPGPR